jgi:predicted O-methyltransferase YrrM
MKLAADTILRPEQAAYLETLQATAHQRVRDDVLARVERRAAEMRYAISDPEVAALLTVSIRAARPRFLVELGTNIGYGAIVMARAAGPDARVVTIERERDLVEEARAFVTAAGLDDRVEVRCGEALSELERIDGAVDFAYVDCAKEEYPRYLELLVPRLSERGVIVADNVLWKGHVASAAVPERELTRTDALRRFNLAIVQHPALRAVVLPRGDGVAYAVRA